MCHQTVSLVAAFLEEAGIPTVIIGSARDIVEEHGVSRFLFTDFPLGNPCGKPWDEIMQRSIVGSAVDLFHGSMAPRTTVQAPFEWGDDGWREGFMKIDDADSLAEAGRRRRVAQKAAR